MALPNGSTLELRDKPRKSLFENVREWFGWK
jgi:hypothetical protein